MADTDKYEGQQSSCGSCHLETRNRPADIRSVVLDSQQDSSQKERRRDDRADTYKSVCRKVNSNRQVDLVTLKLGTDRQTSGLLSWIRHRTPPRRNCGVMTSSYFQISLQKG